MFAPRDKTSTNAQRTTEFVEIGCTINCTHKYRSLNSEVIHGDEKSNRLQGQHFGEEQEELRHTREDTTDAAKKFVSNPSDIPRGGYSLLLDAPSEELPALALNDGVAQVP